MQFCSRRRRRRRRRRRGPGPHGLPKLACTRRSLACTLLDNRRRPKHCLWEPWTVQQAFQDALAGAWTVWQAPPDAAGAPDTYGISARHPPSSPGRSGRHPRTLRQAPAYALAGDPGHPWTLKEAPAAFKFCTNFDIDFSSVFGCQNVAKMDPKASNIDPKCLP